MPRRGPPISPTSVEATDCFSLPECGSVHASATTSVICEWMVIGCPLAGGRLLWGYILVVKIKD